uniref:C2H2-type domain-containing protein n=1 Tax=Timema monikensis TaxID=170555 RepID=A0A7R9E9P3_9NEOP|nr:unnamed protein product [Timema monikensis]
MAGSDVYSEALHLKWEPEEDHEETICGVDDNCIIFPNHHVVPMEDPVALAPGAEGSSQYQYQAQDLLGIQMSEEVVYETWDNGEVVADVVGEEVVGEQELLYKEEDPEIPLPQNQDSYTLMRPYPCDFCSRRFRKKANLMNHMVSHQTDRPHGCNLCGARYRRKCDLINHMKIHAYAPGLAGASDDDDDIPSNHSRENAHPTIKGRRKKAQSSAPKKRRSISSNTQSSREIEFDELSFYKDGKPYSSSRKKNTNIYLDDGVHLPPSSVGGDNEKHAEPSVPKWPITDETRPYVCQHCGVGFAREKALASHARIHAGDSPFECNTCGEMFWDVTLLRDHARNKHRNAVAKYNNDGSYVPDNSYRDFRCEICELSFDTQEHLKRHRKSHIKVEPPSNELMCQLCGETFPDQAELALHADCHARYQPHRCMLCGHCFEDAASVATHVRRRHGKNVPDNTCSLCGKTCKDRRSLQKHSWVHSAERSFPCHKCSKRFHSRARLKRHMVSHRDKAVSCNECGEEFPDGRALINHRHSHNKDLTARQFSCMECGKTFGSRSSQQIHARIHTGERPYGCRFCWKAFADGGTLRKHERIHTGEKPYACVVCPRAFNQRVVLREHIRSHHSGPDKTTNHVNVYSCKVCAASFSRSDELCAHLIHHSDENTARHRMPSLGPRKYKRRRRLMAHELNRFSNFAEKYATSDRRDSDSESDEDLKRKITKKKYKTKSKPSASDSLKTVAKALNSVAEKFNLIVHSKSESGKAKQERKSQKAKRKLAPNRKFAGVSGNSKSKEVAKRPIVNFNSGGFVKRTRPPTEGRVRPRTKNVTSSTLAALKAVSTISKANHEPDMSRVRPRTKNVNYHSTQMSKLSPAVFPDGSPEMSKVVDSEPALDHAAKRNVENGVEHLEDFAAFASFTIKTEPTNNFRCEMCSKTFLNRSELLVHVPIHI